MTTIAWDGRTLAADRLAVAGGGLPREVAKLHSCGPYVFGGSGMLTTTLAIADWLRAGAPDDHRPSLEEGGAHGIVVERVSGRAYVVEGETPMLCPLLERFHASGSGRDFALSAMAMGMSAREAVRFAMRFDVYTGLGIDSMRAGAARGRRRT